MRLFRRARGFSVVVVWVGLTLTPFAATDLVHQDEALDLCLQVEVEHDSADHHFTGETERRQDNAHCDLCHLLRSLRSSEALTRVRYAVDERSARQARVESLTTVDSRSRGRIPSRSPPS